MKMKRENQASRVEIDGPKNWILSFFISKAKVVNAKHKVKRIVVDDDSSQSGSLTGGGGFLTVTNCLLSPFFAVICLLVSGHKES